MVLRRKFTMVVQPMLVQMVVVLLVMFNHDFFRFLHILFDIIIEVCTLKYTFVFIFSVCTY